MAEHRVIERMIAVLSAELDVMAAGGVAHPVRIAAAVDFIRTYADRCHHGKEEDILFRGLAEKPLDPELAAEMEDLIADHVRGRVLTRRLAEAADRYAAGDMAAMGEIEAAMRSLVEFYPLHIEKEDRHFFKPALAQFDDGEKAEMLRAFDAFERTLLHEKYLGVVEELEQGLRQR
jgi:hemerythrin-like domain-containing protein